jgi:immunoglobulin-binding protein 1
MAAMGNPDRVSEEEEADKEMKMERDDPKLLKDARDRDEFKDDHRRGWGNRMNRS